MIGSDPVEPSANVPASEMPLFQDPSHAFSRATVVAFLENFTVPLDNRLAERDSGGLD